MPQTLGETLDQIVTMSFRVGIESLERERIRHLYEIARKRQGGVSLTMQAAQKIVDATRAGDWVFLITGVAESPWFPAGEMDGPPGVVSLARAIAYGLGARPLYLAEPLTLPTCTEPSKAIGVPIHDPDLISRFGIWRAAGALSMPLGPDGAREKAIELLDTYRPAALIACEKLGPNAEGEYAAIGSHMPPEIVDHVAAQLFIEARKRGIVTVGTGDAGNEIGLGVIEDIANEYAGATAYRKGGNGTNITADVGIPATCSNWGCYAISAGIAYLTRNLDAMHTPEMEKLILERCAAGGSVDFTAGVPAVAADGYSLEVNQAIVTLLRRAVEGRLKDRGPSFLPSDFTQLANAWVDMRKSGEYGLSTQR